MLFFGNFVNLIEHMMSKLNLFNITLEKQNDSSTKSYIIIRGIDLTLLNQTKTVYLDKILSGTGVCIKDMELLSITEVSDTCSNTNEIWLNCPGTNSNYICSFVNDTNNNTMYKITGLKHSAIEEQLTHCGDGVCSSSESCSSCSVDCGSCPSTSSGSTTKKSGGGGGSSGGFINKPTDIFFNLSLAGKNYSPNKNQKMHFTYDSVDYIMYIGDISENNIILNINDDTLNVSINQSIKYILNSDSILNLKLSGLSGSSAADIFVKLDTSTKQEDNSVAEITTSNSTSNTTSKSNNVSADNFITGNVVNNQSSTGKIGTPLIIIFVVVVIILTAGILYLRRRHKHSRKK